MQPFILTSAEVKSGVDTHNMVFATPSIDDLPQRVGSKGFSGAKMVSAMGVR